MEKKVSQMLENRNAASRIMQSISSRSKMEKSQSILPESESAARDLGKGDAVPVESSKRILTEKQKKKILEGNMKTDFESVVTPEEKAAKKAAKKKGKGKKEKKKGVTINDEVSEREFVKEAEPAEVAQEGKEEVVKKDKKGKGKPKEEKDVEEKKSKKSKKSKEDSEKSGDGKKSKKKGLSKSKDRLLSRDKLKSMDQFQSKQEFKSTEKLASQENFKSVEQFHSKVEFKSKSNLPSKDKLKSTEKLQSKHKMKSSQKMSVEESFVEIGTGSESGAIEQSKVSFAVSKKKGKKGKKGEKVNAKLRTKQKSVMRPKSSDYDLEGEDEEGEKDPSHLKFAKRVSIMQDKRYRRTSTFGSFGSRKEFSRTSLGRVASFFDDSSSSSSADDSSRKKAKKKTGKKEKGKKGKKKEEEGEEKGETEGKKKSKKKGAKEKTESEATKSAPTSTAESGTEESEKGKKKKKKKGKKGRKKKEKELTPKERAKLEEERKLQAEADAIREAEEERQRQIEERRMGIAKAKREAAEQLLRIEQLENSSEFIESVIEAGREAYAADKVVEDWEEYLCCDGLPKPWNPAEMNTYLHLWEKEINTVTVEQAVRRTDEIIKLLDDLETLINDPFDHSLQRQADWKWIRTEFRAHQKDNLDYATYRLLRYISNRMNRIDIPTADFRLGETNFSLCLWTLIKLPTPTPNPRIPGRPRLQVEWPEMKVEILFPHSLHCENLAVRGMYVKYDHLSDTCDSYDPPAPPDFYNKELGDLTAQEWFVKMRYKYNNRVIVKKEPEEVVLEDGTITLVEVDAEPELAPDELPPEVPFQLLQPTASTFALSLEKEEFDQKCVPVSVPENVLNMRKFQVIGGIYHLNLFVQPPQPQEMVSFEIFVSTLMVPCSLTEAYFFVGYTPPPPTEPGVRKEPEEIEEEMNRMERELDELIFVNLILPEHVFWLEAPVVCQWDMELNAWSTADVHDLKYFEDKGYLTFRTGKFGPFALALYKYSNLPFQAWEIRPEPDGSITFQLTAAILVVEFNVKGYLVCISQLQNEPNDAMQAHIGVYYKLPKLITILRSFGVDIFPCHDTFFYVEGTCEKHWPMEKQLYYGMALGSIAYNFSWSRWNMTLDYRNVAFQLRMYKFNKPKQLSFSMCLVTPLKAALVDCTEVSPTFNQEPVEGSKFYADFLFMIRGVSNMATKNKLQAAPLETVNTLANLFLATRFLSFS